MIGFLGLGEAGTAIARGLAEEGVRVSAYDVALTNPADAGLVRERAGEIGVDLAGNAAELAERAEVILALVTGAVAVKAAEGIVPYLTARHIYLDLNSASPSTKQEVARAVSAAGAQMVDGAVMAAVPPRRHRVPILLAGTAAAQVAARLTPLGFSLEVVGTEPGQASAIKMCRSLLVKGVEALLWECVAVADAYGAADRVLAGAGDALGGGDWRQLGAYLMSRTVQHGERRAHELSDVANTARAAGVEPMITAAAQARLRAVSERMTHQPPGPVPDGLNELIALLREVLRP